MTKKRRNFFLYAFTSLIVIAISFPGCGRGGRGAELEGTWQGELRVTGVATLRVVFRFEKDSSGAYHASLDSPDQGAAGIPVENVSVSGRTVRVSARSIMGSYQGKVSEDGSRIEGQWTQGGATLPLELARVEKAPVINRPQEPKKPYGYDATDVVYENKEAGIVLAGTFTLPRTGGRFPAVILISGSGPQDRDETVFGHRPFLVLADYLTRQGIAVLRVDDRGVGGSTGDVEHSTAIDFAGDVLAGVEYLKTRPEVDKRRIGLIGHSEGGIIAPLAAGRSPDVAFIVLMAGTGLPGEEILYLQNYYIGRALGKSAAEIAANRSIQERMFAIVKQESDTLAAREKLRKLLEESLAGQAGENAGQFIDSQIRSVLSTWFKFFLTYDPIPALKQVRCPVLAIIGENDRQVPPQENLAPIEEALRAGGNNRGKVKEMPGLNHLFQTSATGSVADYARIEETIAPAALEEISGWILTTVAKIK